jgi:hypothetical protein
MRFDSAALRHRSTSSLRKTPMTIVYRPMRAAHDGHPQPGNTKRSLGVVDAGESADVIPDEEGIVHPDGGGMSVVQRRRDVPYYREKRDPVWKLDTDALPVTLQYRQDSKTHGVIEPAVSMPLDTYRETLAETRQDWERD